MNWWTALALVSGGAIGQILGQFLFRLHHRPARPAIPSFIAGPTHPCSVCRGDADAKSGDTTPVEVTMMMFPDLPVTAWICQPCAAIVNPLGGTA